MNIIRRELRAHLKAFIIWSASMVAIIVMMMTEFSAYYENPEMADILNQMPKELMDAFGMGNANLTTVSGYISIAALYFYLMLGAYAVLYGCGIIAKEERDKTAEFLMVMPVTRVKIIGAKAIAAVLGCIGLTIITGLTVYGVTLQYAPDQEFYQFLVLMLIALLLIELIFLSIGMMLAAVLKRYKISGALSISILMGMYLMYVLSSLSNKVEFFKYFSPFKYFEANQLLNELSFDWIYVGLSILMMLVGMIVTFVVYPRRDLR